jgi:hypothetical protein
VAVVDYAPGTPGVAPPRDFRNASEGFADDIPASIATTAPARPVASPRHSKELGVLPLLNAQHRTRVLSDAWRIAGRSCWPNRGGDGTEVITDTDWGDRGLCKSADPDELFVGGAAQNRAKAVCTGCPVRTECLAYALDQRIEHGVWGGMTERERRALLRR